MDIGLIHKLGKNNVVLNVLSCKEKYQGEMLGKVFKFSEPCLLEKKL
jgi:hypothetical protein